MPDPSYTRYRRIAGWLPFFTLEDRLYGVLVFGVCAPLVTLSCFLIFSPGNWSLGSLVATVLTGTVVALGTSMWIVTQLLTPLRQVRHTLSRYRDERGLLNLPREIDDDCGELMADLHSLIQHSERQRAHLETVHSIASAHADRVLAADNAAPPPHSDKVVPLRPTARAARSHTQPGA